MCSNSAYLPQDTSGNGNELGAYTKVDEQRRGQIVWPEIDVDPKNPLGVEKTTKGP